MANQKWKRGLEIAPRHFSPLPVEKWQDLTREMATKYKLGPHVRIVASNAHRQREWGTGYLVADTRDIIYLITAMHCAVVNGRYATSMSISRFEKLIPRGQGIAEDSKRCRSEPVGGPDGLAFVVGDDEADLAIYQTHFRREDVNTVNLAVTSSEPHGSRWESSAFPRRLFGRPSKSSPTMIYEEVLHGEITSSSLHIGAKSQRRIQEWELSCPPFRNKIAPHGCSGAPVTVTAYRATGGDVTGKKSDPESYTVATLVRTPSLGLYVREGDDVLEEQLASRTVADNEEGIMKFIETHHPDNAILEQCMNRERGAWPEWISEKSDYLMYCVIRAMYIDIIDGREFPADAAPTNKRELLRKYYHRHASFFANPVVFDDDSRPIPTCSLAYAVPSIELILMLAQKKHCDLVFPVSRLTYNKKHFEWRATEVSDSQREAARMSPTVRPRYWVAMGLIGLILFAPIFFFRCLGS